MKYYTPEMVSSGQHGICIQCNKPPTKDGHDGCLGELRGNIMNACCGHGSNTAYIQYWGEGERGTAIEESTRRTIRGYSAAVEQLRLIK
jgi:hypothetical protein